MESYNIYSFAWLLSLNIMCSRLIQVVTSLSTSFLFVIQWYFIVWTYHIFLFIHLSLDGLLGCSHFGLLWILLLWTFLNRILCGHMFSIILHVYSGEELLGHMVTMFKFLMSCQICFQSVCTIIHSPQQCFNLFKSSSILFIVHLYITLHFLLYNYPWWEVVSLCFDLHFPNE